MLKQVPAGIRELMLYAYGASWFIGVVAVLTIMNLDWHRNPTLIAPVAIVVFSALALLTVLELAAAWLIVAIVKKRRGTQVPRDVNS